MKDKAYKAQKSSIISWLLLIFVIETFFVFAAMSASYTLMAIAMVSALVAAIFARPQLKIYISVFGASLFSFMIYFTIGALVSQEYVDLFFYWTGFLLVIISAKYEHQFETLDFLKVLRFLGIIFAAGVILQVVFVDFFMNNYYPLFGEEYRQSIRRQVVFHKMYPGWTSQTFATSLNLIIGFFSTWLIYKEDKENKNLIVLVFISASLLLTGKRGPIIFFVVALITCETITSPNLKKMFARFWKYLIMAVVLFAVLLVYTKSHGADSRNTIIRLLEAFNGEEDISNGRFILWSYAWELFLQSPLIGNGWGTYSILSPSTIGENIEAHNVYLQLLAEMGIIGLSLYLLMIGSAFTGTLTTYVRSNRLRMKKNKNMLKFSLMLQVFMHLYALTGNILYDYCALLLLFFAYCIYLSAKRDVAAMTCKRVVTEKQ